MKKVIKEISCDLCKEIATHQDQTMQVIFTTEQTEGRGVNPYFSMQKLDLCDYCLKVALTGRYIWANGAQGYNNYYFPS